MGGVITGTAFTKQFPSINITTANGNATLQGFVVASYNIGCWAGALLVMGIGERLGRKRTLIVGPTILAIGTVIQCSSYGLPQLIVSPMARLYPSNGADVYQVGRIVTGTGNGVITSTIPVWHAEMLKPGSRGRFITMELSTNVVSKPKKLVTCVAEPIRVAWPSLTGLTTA